MDDMDWSLFDRYIAGVATPDEREEFERWLAEDPERSVMVDTLRNALAGVDRGVSGQELDDIWQGIADRTGVGQSRPAFAASPRTKPGRFALPHSARAGWRLAAGIAASVAMVVGAALVLHPYWRSGGSRITAEGRVVSVPRGQRASLQLPDGTEVLLGAGSILRHPYAFPSDIREVQLEGEAYFRVVHDAQRPFRVRAGDLVATELGTEFMVRAYPEQTNGRVIVRSGTVAVRAASGSSGEIGEVIRPGELGRLDSAGTPTVEPADTASYFAWTTGTLVFDGIPLAEALPQLSRWYDLDFHLADSVLGTIPLSGRMDQALTPSRLELLAASLGLSQVRRGREVTFFRPMRDAR